MNLKKKKKKSALNISTRYSLELRYMYIMESTRKSQEKEVQTSIFSSINGVVPDDLKSSSSNIQCPSLSIEAGIYLP